MILLVVFALFPFSSNLVLWFDYDGNPVTLTDRIDSVNQYYDNMEPTYNGVSLRTEFDTYSPNTKRILAYWENKTDIEFMYGDSWHLFKKQGDEFVPVILITEENYAWGLVGYSLKPHKIQKDIFAIEPPVTDKLTPGVYKIKTDFSSGRVETFKQYVIEAEFTVSDDKSKWGVSALDFLNGENADKFTMIGGGTYPNSSFCLYKNKKTYDTILTDGIYQYEIGQGSGKWGVVHNWFYEADGKIYLVYSYSRDDTGKYCSYICVLDLTDNSDVKEIYKSEPFLSDYIVGLSLNPKDTDDGQTVTDENDDWVMDNKFGVFFEDWHEYESGGYSGAVMGDIGWLIYENGGFHYEKNAE